MRFMVAIEQCNMQQTIQLGQVQPSVLSQVGAVVKNLKQCAAAWCSKHEEQLVCYVGGPLIMAFCFALYFFAAVLQGGAL